eukprot:m.69989 g.69989  ORF g.69989 m.69989 type:complete len:575 (+) comp14147_c0_seq1:110-1834(+)
MAGRIIAATAIFLLAFASSKIIDINDEDPATWSYHVHTETLFKAPSNSSKYPFIQLEVQCPEGATTVSYLIVKTVVAGIGRVVRSDENDVVTARCMANKFCSRMDDSRREDTSTTTPSSSKATPPSPPGSPVNDTVQTTDENYYIVDVPTGFVCHEESGLMYREDIVHGVLGGCMECPSDESHIMKFQGSFFSHEGYYTLWVETNSDKIEEPEQLRGSTTFRNLDGYLEAALMPERTFYGVLGLFYLFLGLFWLALLGLHFKDLLRVQFWIGGVVFLGMLEMSVSYGDLDHLNKHGYRSKGLMIFAKLLFAGKNTLARLLVLVVSMGYGIVKPRIGNSFKQIVALGLSYYFFAAAYGVTHALGKTESAENKTEMMVVVPLSILDAAICWWIFMSLAHTMKILSLRNNESKLLLYTRFQWALIACVAATIIFATWTITEHLKVNKDDEPDWRNQWWLEGYWHLLFFCILVVIMYLWRPTQNNQRYAYSALENGDDEEEEFEVVPNFQQDAMKMRNLQSRNNPSRPDFDDDEDEDLRWVEENIPSVVANADSGFGNLPMDSDEELMHTRFEMSKME